MTGPGTRHPGIRWTVGDVSRRGWEALRLSVHCAVRLFGPAAEYLVCVNSVPLGKAQALAGELPGAVGWREITAAEIPPGLRAHLDPEMAEGVGWKLVPPQVFPARHEIALDNDCILWDLPDAMQEFLSRTDATLLAEDVTRCLGQFDRVPHVAGEVNSGIRGLPPGFALMPELLASLAEAEAASGEPVLLRSELDEQGLQAAALHRSPCLRVLRQEVAICSPFWPRQPEPGSCGAHFVGLNSRHLPWNYYDRPGDHVRREHYDRLRPELFARAGLPLTAPLGLDEA